MSERYIITGVQLALLIALESKRRRQKLVDVIVNKQFVGSRKAGVVRKITGDALK